MIKDGNTNRITEVAAPPTRDTMAAAVLVFQRPEEGDLLLVKVQGGNNKTSISNKKR